MNLEELMASTPPMQQHALIKGFQAGAASRDAEIQRLQLALADAEALELGTAERCDQLREQVALLREALKEICSDYEDRFDMGSPSTNPGMKFVVKQARELLAATESKQPNQPDTIAI